MNSSIRDMGKKFGASVLAVSFAATLGGCMLFDKTDYEMTDAGIALARALKHHDAEEIIDLDLDEANDRKVELRSDLDFSADGPYVPSTGSAYDSICATMRYYIDESTVELASNGRSGEATFIFEFKDFDQVRRDDEYMTDPVAFTSGLVQCDDYEEVEVDMEFELDGGEWKVTNFDEVYEDVFFFLGEEFDFVSPLEGKVRSLDWVDSDNYEGNAYYINVSSIELDLTKSGNDDGWDDVFYVVSFSEDGENFDQIYTADPSLRGVYGESQGAELQSGYLPCGYYNITFLDGYGTAIGQDTCYVDGYYDSYDYE